MGSRDVKKLALHCAGVADDKKGNEILVLDIRHVSSIADYFVIASGGSDKHVRAMADEIALRSEEELGQKPYHVQGLVEGQWVIIDFVDVVVHLFTEPSRKYYNLDRLWGDAKVVKKA